MEERYKCMVVVDLMLTRNNNGKKEILLALRQNTGYHDGNYELPGGHIEADEDIMQAMIREVKEELCIDIKREDLKIEHIFHHYKGERVKIILSTNSYTGEPKVGEPNKCGGLKWFDLDDIPPNFNDRTRKILKEIQNGIFYDNSDLIYFFEKNID